MDAFDQMRNMNIATSNMDPDNMDTNIQQQHQQQQQQQILHHPHHYQDNNYGVVPGIQEHHDQLHHSMHVGVGHLEPNNHLEESSHINQLSSHIDPSNMHHQHHHHHHHMNDSVSGDVSNISDIGHLPVEPVIEKVNNYEQHSENLVHSNIRDDNGVPTVEKVLFEAITSFDDDASQNVQSNLAETLINKDENEKIDDDGNCETEKIDDGGGGGSTDKIIEDENEKVDSNDVEDCKDNIIDENPVEQEIVPVEGDAAIVEPVETIEPTKPNGVTEVILMDEPAVDTEGEEEGVEENQEDVLAGELADTEVAKAIDVKPITNFVIKVKDIMKDDKTLQQINRRSGRKTPAIKSESPLLQSDNKRAGPKSRARSNTPIDHIKKNNSSSATGNQTSSTKKGEDIDENQCRICLSKDDLVSIFKSENRQTIADKIITICTGVRIQRKDFLPQFICNTCMQSVQVAYNLKRLCEATDKDLRSKLSRSKKNMRRPTEYVLLDATKFGESDESIDEPSDDDEFKISNEEELKSSEQESEADSDYGSGKRRSRRVRSRKSTGPSRRRRRASKPTAPAQKSTAPTFRQVTVKQATPAATTSRSIPSSRSTPSRSAPSSRPGPASVKRGRKSDSSFEQNPITTNPDFSSGSDDNFSPPKKRQSRSSGGLNNNNSTSTQPVVAKSNASKEGHCVYCNEIFPSQNALQKHKKIHAGEKPLICDLCGKTFKMAPSYQAHLAKHTEDGDTLMCTKCDKTFQKLSERRKHMIDEHNEKPETFPCEKCKRVFSLKKSLEKHIEDGKCPGPRKSITTNTASAAAPQQQQQQQQQRRVKSEMENLTLGRDLFKCVAPVTTTYWSDSFSD